MLPTNHPNSEINARNCAMNWLLQHFPDAFNLTNRKPLKQTILDDILALTHVKTPNSAALKAAIDYYMHWGTYLNAIKSGSKRIDLNGNVCGVVTEDEEYRAKELLTEEKKKQQTQKQ